MLSLTPPTRQGSLHPDPLDVSPSARCVLLLSVPCSRSPTSYFHVFVFGMCLARLRERLKAELAPLAIRQPPERLRPLLLILKHGAIGWGTSIAYTLLCLIFFIRDVRPYSWKLSTRLGLLMIPQVESYIHTCMRICDSRSVW